jgi:hypothetical protein
MMLGQQVIEAVHRFRRDDLDDQMNENLLFIDGGLAKSGSAGLFHSGSIKSCRRVVPQNPSLLFPVNTYSYRKTRPNPAAVRDRSLV